EILTSLLSLNVPLYKVTLLLCALCILLERISILKEELALASFIYLIVYVLFAKRVRLILLEGISEVGLASICTVCKILSSSIYLLVRLPASLISAIKNSTFSVCTSIFACSIPIFNVSGFS